MQRTERANTKTYFRGKRFTLKIIVVVLVVKIIIIVIKKKKKQLGNSNNNNKENKITKEIYWKVQI